MFTGCGTALITPFRKNGSLDEEALNRLIQRQIECGIDFLVPCGTTGESPTLTREEHLAVVRATVDLAKPRGIPVLAGAGGNNTHEVIELARECQSVGADGILSVTPYYNKPTQEGLFQHYRAIVAAIEIPLVVYSVQGRTGVNVEPATLARLAGLRGIVGVKEASGNISQQTAVIHQVPPEFLVLSGDDAITLPLIALGGKGLISVASNIIPREMTELVRAALGGDFRRARELQRQWLPLMEVNFIESNPIPVKAALAAMGLIENAYRLPMVPPRPESLAKIEAVLAAAGMLRHMATQ
jgi:4-hydroxy-tetrahydrodipicolinate synthase